MKQFLTGLTLLIVAMAMTDVKAKVDGGSRIFGINKFYNINNSDRDQEMDRQDHRRQHQQQKQNNNVIPVLPPMDIRTQVELNLMGI